MDYLYRYTSLESLALILAKHKIRFNSLDKMDDLQEQQSADIVNLGRHIFISSWTEDDNESIPMWNMYSSIKSGVRIRLKKYPFKEYACTKEYLESFVDLPIVDESKGGSPFKTVFPLHDMYKRQYSPACSTQQKDILFKVEYTEDKDKLYPKLLSANREAINIAFGKMGKYKNTSWDFQKEWRYIVPLLPLNFFNYNNIEQRLYELETNLIQGTLEPAMDHYELEIDEDAFTEMVITISPAMSEGNKIILRNLVEKYNPDATIEHSKLEGLL